MKLSHKECIQSLFRSPVMRHKSKLWHARTSNAITAKKLTDKDGIDLNEFKQWAFSNWSDELAADRDSLYCPVVPAGLTMQSSVGQVYVAILPPETTTRQDLLEQIASLQIELAREQTAHAATKKELEALKAKFAKCRADGKTGGRGNEK
jgi:hypothetical protein